jgi:deoxyribonuclease-4
VAAGISRVAAAVNRLFAELPDDEVVLCLESTAGQGSTLGRTFEELAAILAAVEDSRRVGVCLDTCHLFAAGFPLAPAAAYRQTMRAFADTVGLERLRAFHLNDSQTPFGSRKDRHEHIGQGQIGLEAFAQVVNDPALCQVSLILETPKPDDVDDLSWDIENLKVLRGLIRQTKTRTSTAAPKERTKSPTKRTATPRSKRNP